MHHRLDVWTSGVLVFSRSELGKETLSRVFEERLCQKHYRAVCVGTPDSPSGQLEDFIAKKRVGGRDLMRKVRSGGKKAITKFTVLETFDGLSSVVFELITGRRHQIRVQAAIAGFPVLGDKLYADEEAFGQTERALHRCLEGQRLHAEHFSFDDPISGKPLVFSAPIPSPWVPTLERPSRQNKETRLIAFHKPFGVLCSFTKPRADERCLGDFDLPKGVYPAGRLDKDSEGLVVLTDDGKVQHRLAHPTFEKAKTYWVQVEGRPTEDSLSKLREGVSIGEYLCKPAEVEIMPDPGMPEREPPIRYRKSTPTSWLRLTISEGKNRQVRRMTAAVGYPTLRLIRIAVGKIELGSLRPGESRAVSIPF